MKIILFAMKEMLLKPFYYFKINPHLPTPPLFTALSPRKFKRAS
jgi:hypothetical protein